MGPWFGSQQPPTWKGALRKRAMAPLQELLGTWLGVQVLRGEAAYGPAGLEECEPGAPNVSSGIGFDTCD